MCGWLRTKTIQRKNLLKLIAIVSLFALVLIGSAYLFVRTDLETASHEICKWINDANDNDFNFSVGPNAFERLMKLRRSHESYRCSIEASPEKSSLEHEITILIRSGGKKVIPLFYEPAFYNFSYIKHWTGDFLHRHK